MRIECRKCGRTPFEGANLKRVNPKGQVGIWECAVPCGTPYISEEAKVTHAIVGDSDTAKGDTND